MRGASVIAVLAGLSLFAPAVAHCQAPLQFDAASVRPHAPGDDEFTSSPQFLPGGRFVSKGPLFFVIAAAYDLLPYRGSRLTGGPDWLRTRSGALDIQATSVNPAGLSVQDRNDRMRMMLQALLADRFKLKIRRETKEMPVYALVVAKGGPKLQKADIQEKDCTEGPFIVMPGTPNTACHSFIGGQARAIHARAVTLADVVTYVENWTDRPLVDKTGIKGLYQIETPHWQPMDPGSSPPPPGAKQDGVDVADLPTIFEVFEKLGLKIESQRGQVEMYVIEHVEKPSGN
jgi:bla regulator protein blaR1